MLTSEQITTATTEQLEHTLYRIRRELARRNRQGESDTPSDDIPPLSSVVEYRPHADGMLQAEMRSSVRRDGSVKERGPYWYFRYHAGGKQKKLYLGLTDDPEGKLAEKREAKGLGYI
jgi:hypothetical protein